MYLVGIMKRDEWYDSNPMREAGIVLAITRDHLVKARQDDEYNVINLATREYYNPKSNSWEKIQDLDSE